MIFPPRSTPEEPEYVGVSVTGSIPVIFEGSPRNTGHPGTGVPSAWNA